MQLSSHNSDGYWLSASSFYMLALTKNEATVNPMKPKCESISRREFATRAALGAVAAVTPLSPVATAGLSTFVYPQLPPDASKLPAQSQAEAEARHQAILSQYADRFSDTQKNDLRRLCFVLQPQLDSLRVWPVANSDAPALYLKPLVEREKKTNAAPNLKSAPQSAKPESVTKPGNSEKH